MHPNLFMEACFWKSPKALFCLATLRCDVIAWECMRSRTNTWYSITDVILNICYNQNHVSYLSLLITCSGFHILRITQVQQLHEKNNSDDDERRDMTLQLMTEPTSESDNMGRAQEIGRQSFQWRKNPCFQTLLGKIPLHKFDGKSEKT